jgi:hypothetical protein
MEPKVTQIDRFYNIFPSTDEIRYTDRSSPQKNVRIAENENVCHDIEVDPGERTKFHAASAKSLSTRYPPFKPSKK